LRAQKWLLILLSILSFAPLLRAAAPACSQIYAEPRSSKIAYLRPQSVKMSRSFLRSTYDFQVLAAKKDKEIIMALAKRQSLREMVESEFDHGDLIVQIRIPKNIMATEIVEAKKVHGLEDAKELAHKVPTSGGVANRIGLHAQFAELFEVLNFVFSRYKEDKTWPDEFYRNLARWSFRYFFQSTYIIVRAKTADGKLGPIVGTARLITVPYKTQEPIQTENGTVVLAKTDNWDSVDVRSGNEFITDNIEIPPHLMNSFWKDLFPKGVIDFGDGGTTLRSPETVTAGGMTFVPTPMESVLQQVILGLRVDADHDLRNLIEPGNFSIDRKYSKTAAPFLYLHMARLAQAPHAQHSQGQNSKSITYAEEDSDTHRYYQSLGLHPLPQKLVKSPTNKVWDILGGGPGALLGAFKTRFARNPELAAAVDEMIQGFNQIESQYWLEEDSAANSTEGRNFGFTNPPPQQITPVEKLF
jgi:hypothetical protein